MKQTTNQIQELFENHLEGSIFGLEHDFLIESTDPIQIKIAYCNQDQLRLRYTKQNYWVGVFENNEQNNLYFGCSENLSNILDQIIQDMCNVFRHLN